MRWESGILHKKMQESSSKRANIFVRQDSWSPRRKVSRVSLEQMKESERRKAVINQCMTVLSHSSQCEDTKCDFIRCSTMKNVWKHFNGCPENKKSNPKCAMCNSVVSLLNYHSNTCKDDSCKMRRCRQLKEKFLIWQNAEQDFLNKLVEFRLGAVPTVKKKETNHNTSKSSINIEDTGLPGAFSETIEKVDVHKKTFEEESGNPGKSNNAVTIV